jgi:hypothetical protein
MMFVSLVFLVSLTSAAAADVQESRMTCLARAYPDHLRPPTDRYRLESHTGQTYPFNPQATYQNYEEELDKADLFSQLRQPYPLAATNAPPKRNADPGRLRHEPLFLDMYGHSAAEVSGNLVPVYWRPCDCTLQFSRVNGAAKALEASGKAIEKAGLSRYVTTPIGTFNWRTIAGTKRLSMHAFGIAIDFKLPEALGRYWRWELARLQKANDESWYPIEILQDETLNRIVAIFESHGFVWGGKWWHYDSIHFEYRPELSLFGCAQG